MRPGILIYSVLAVSMLLLTGCASSSFSRGAVAHASALSEGSSGAPGGQNNPAALWSNASPVAQGVILGAATGTVVGATTAIGWAPGAAGGALIGLVAGAAVHEHTTLADKLENRGCAVM